MPALKPSESIEGLEVGGHSRDPLRYQRTIKTNGIKYFLYKTEFDVFAEIVVELIPGTPQIEKKALVKKGDTIRCDTALITTIAHGRTPPLFRQKAVSHESHTHGASEWEFSQKTNVKVVTPRQEIINALQKRNGNTQNKAVITNGRSGSHNRCQISS
jgi:hypothetical protein